MQDASGISDAAALACRESFATGKVMHWKGGGLAGLAVVAGLVRRGRFDSRDRWGVEGVIKYWHFVDVAWVFIFPTIYLVS